MTDQLHFEDVSEGDTAPRVSHELSRTDFVRYAGASGDYNPMHHDEVKAQEAGQPSVFGHGMLSMGIAGRALTDWVGVGHLTRFKVRFTQQTWPDDVLTSQITVTDKRTEDDRALVDLEVELVNQDDEPVVSGAATARLPRRG